MWANAGWLRSVTGEQGKERQRGRCGAVYMFLGPESWIVLSRFELKTLLNVRNGHKADIQNLFLNVRFL